MSPELPRRMAGEGSRPDAGAAGAKITEAAADRVADDPPGGCPGRPAGLPLILGGWTCRPASRWRPSRASGAASAASASAGRRPTSRCCGPCVDNRAWLSAQEFEDGVATTNLLPGPGSTQLAIYCAWRLRGPLGALVGGFCFIVPGLIVILALSALILAAHPPRWVSGAAAGAGAAVPAVCSARRSGWRWRVAPRRPGTGTGRRWAGGRRAWARGAGPVDRVPDRRSGRGRATGPFLVLVLTACGLPSSWSPPPPACLRARPG